MPNFVITKIVTQRKKTGSEVPEYISHQLSRKVFRAKIELYNRGNSYQTQ